MRGTSQSLWLLQVLVQVLVLALVPLTVACSGPPEGKVPVPGVEDALKTEASLRAERRAYDGAPPVIPHENLGIECTACHNQEGMEVADLGYAPASPHERTPGMSSASRCRQCHVFRQSESVFVANRFTGLEQDLRRGGRFYDGAPPTIPHKVFMRETCTACHTGPAAREEIRTSHPERTRCRQCHVAVNTRADPWPAGNRVSSEGGTEP